MLNHLNESEGDTYTHLLSAAVKAFNFASCSRDHCEDFTMLHSQGVQCL